MRDYKSHYRLQDDSYPTVHSACRLNKWTLIEGFSCSASAGLNVYARDRKTHLNCSSDYSSVKCFTKRDQFIFVQGALVEFRWKEIVQHPHQESDPDLRSALNGCGGALKTRSEGLRCFEDAPQVPESRA